MDWAEELKMSIRKTTARKGRRSKSRDALQDNDGKSPQNVKSGVTSPVVTNKEISIDITLDMQNGGSTPTTATPQSLSNNFLDAETKQRPPLLRRISGGWADTGNSKTSKGKKGSFEDERFQYLKSATNSPSHDDIPIIPDMDDIKDEIMLNEISDTPNFDVNRVTTLKELNSDILSQNAFNAVEDADLSILTRCLHPPETLDEADEVWEWEKLFTEVIAQINSDKPPNPIPVQKLEIGPDELPPMMPHM